MTVIDVVRYSLVDGIALLEMRRQPVNSLGLELRQSLMRSLDRALHDRDVQAVVLAGMPNFFSAGADVTEFGRPEMTRSPGLRQVIKGFEDAEKIVVAAIAGKCLGGGLELALGCHYRVADASAVLGLPEVKLGILPGAGGTQRLPRLVGIDQALDLIGTGRTLSGNDLQASALIDYFVDRDVLSAALSFARNAVLAKRPVRKTREIVLEDPLAEPLVDVALRSARTREKFLPAPSKCVEAVGAAARLSFEEGMMIERKLFLELLGTAESRALRHIFSAERMASRALRVDTQSVPSQIQRAAVIGSGLMGTGIAMTLANAGLPVTLMDLNPDALARGIESIQKQYETAVKRGRSTPDRIAQTLKLISTATSFDALHDRDLIIEAVPEDMEIKLEVFREIDRVTGSSAILATNTSSLDVDKLALATRRPSQVVGLHFFSPAHVMRLLEVVRGSHLSDDVLVTVLQLARRLGKVAVVSGNCDGFIGNRMAARYAKAANDALVQGASPRQVDTALQSFGMAMGPFRMSDLTGLDISWAIRKRRARECPARQPRVVADALCEAGRFGQKAGAGWYRYEGGQRTPLPDPHVDQLIADYRLQEGIEPRVLSDSDIVNRCVLALVNEGARILEEGIAERASDIDLVYLYGFGFPRHRGGPMNYAEELGIGNVVDMLKKIASESRGDAEFWSPAPLLLRLAESGEGFR